MSTPFLKKIPKRQARTERPIGTARACKHKKIGCKPFRYGGAANFIVPFYQTSNPSASPIRAPTKT